jgi:Protein of unknown function (DUF3572)
LFGFRLIFQANPMKSRFSPVIVTPLCNQAFNALLRMISPSVCGKSLAKPMPKVILDADAATAVSFKALAFLAGDGDRLGRFMALTGIEPGAIRALAREPSFQAAVLEHLLADESMLLQFCENEAIDAALPGLALRLLAGTAETDP